MLNIKMTPIEIDGNALLVAGGLVFFTFVLLFVEWKFQSDAQVFQVIATITGGFSSSLFTLLKSKAEGHAPAPAPPPPAPVTPPVTPTSAP